MTTKPGVKMFIAVILLSAGSVPAAAFPLPEDAQWEMIKYPAGYGCGLFAENQS